MRVSVEELADTHNRRYSPSHESPAEEEGYASPVEAAETSRSIQFGRCPGQRSARGRSLLESLQCVHRLSNEDGRCSVCEARHEALGAYHCI